MITDFTLIFIITASLPKMMDLLQAPIILTIGLDTQILIIVMLEVLATHLQEVFQLIMMILSLLQDLLQF